jgi:hypothetical protein
MYGRKKARPWKIFENDAEKKRGLANTEVSSLASEGWCIVVGNRGFIKRSVGPTRRNFVVVSAIKRRDGRRGDQPFQMRRPVWSWRTHISGAVFPQ